MSRRHPHQVVPEQTPVYIVPQQQQQQPVVYGSYTTIGLPEEESAASSRHAQSQGGHIAIIILLVLLVLGVIAAAIGAGIAAAQTKDCGKCCKKRMRLQWVLAPGGECDDMNPCTADFIDHEDDDDKVVCKNHPRPNGFPCNSTCFFEEEEGTHQCKNLGKGCAECRGTRCKGECRRDDDCPTRRGRGPLVRVPQQASCMDGICVWEFFEEFRIFNFPCDVEVLRRRCMRFVKPRFRDCIIAEPTCGIQFPGGKKRDELPLLPKEDNSIEDDLPKGEGDERGSHGGNGDTGPVLTRCAFSFKCARPKEPYIPKRGEHSFSKGDDSFSSIDSFLQDADGITVEDFKKLTKKSTKSSAGRPRRSSARLSRHGIEGATPK